MKKLLFILPILLSGCATPQPYATEVNANNSRQAIADSIPIIKIASETATRLATQYAERDEANRAELRFEINVVASSLDSLLDSGKVDPESVTSALKVKEPYINDILAGVAILYTATHKRLQENDSADLAIEVLRALAQGVRDGSR